MGLDIDRENFTEKDHREFGTRLQNSLHILRDLLAEPGFGQGPLSLGAEVEAYITRPDGGVLPINKTLVDELQHPQLQLELNRYNIEYNLQPVQLQGTPFSSLENELTAALDMLQQAARGHAGQVIPIGILPTLQLPDLDGSAMTDLPRYRVLSKSLKALRGEDFVVNIRGDDSLQVTSSNVMLEGANTSFQIHLRVEPERFADTFNTLQLVTPLVLALSANSPLLLQKLLWEETRIALFKQSVDYRMRGRGNWQEPARVAFGHGWVRDGAWELFAETVSLHRPIMPVLSDATAVAGGTPELPELRLHMGSVWPWNRAVYDNSDGGHLRIEMRALPAGPSSGDMVANTALYVGLAMGLRDYVRDWLPSIPFPYAEYNFYRAAQQGLDAVLVWPHRKRQRVVETPLLSILEAVLPYAGKGLAAAGVDAADISRYLAIVERRFQQRLTPSRWQRETLAFYQQAGNDRLAACRKMLQQYCREQARGKVLSDWALPS
ncbi:glutamate--cysteine ligase [Exilibacterium tricleocarpae]|uniref:glutamate--cysteine ligase n=1 Tax=Exilibacterium tricleocarpae TaxID=2591008 RepID=UPI0015D1D305|nr:glutamate--cysteine ligase [Exilibacterium tricleocarpae]